MHLKSKVFLVGRTVSNRKNAYNAVIVTFKIKIIILITLLSSVDVCEA